MDVGALNDKITTLNSGLGTLISTLYLSLMGIAIVAVIVLSIISIFCDEQSAQRYKRWRMNVIKAVVVGFCIGAVFALIKAFAGDWWGQTDFTDLAGTGS